MNEIFSEVVVFLFLSDLTNYTKWRDNESICNRILAMCAYLSTFGRIDAMELRGIVHTSKLFAILGQPSRQ